jgi:hypothetical protein
LICHKLRNQTENISKSIVLSNRILQKIEQEASKQKRSRSEWVELHFETFFFKPSKPESEIAVKSI